MKSDFMLCAEGNLILVDPAAREVIGDEQPKLRDGHLRDRNGTSIADQITGVRGAGYANFNPYDLRAGNLVTGMDPILRDCVRVRRHGPRNILSVEMHFQDDVFPSAGVLSLEILGRILQRAIESVSKNLPPIYEITSERYAAERGILEEQLHGQSRDGYVGSQSNEQAIGKAS